VLLTIPDLLDADELAAVRARLAGAVWDDGRATAGPQAATVKRNRQLAPRGDDTQALQAIVEPALRRHPLLFSAALPRRWLPPLFNRYGGDANSYGDHVDQAIRMLPDGTRLRADLSCTLFLSDPADYDGGELVVDDPGAPLRAKLPAGHALLYPASRVHRVEPVTRGVRLASFFWIESMVRDETQRRLLFDFDMALLKLRIRDGESAEAVALTGTYHNLLRLWADA
jgi:PKHD-type hydroxylase